jgi:hypothetical protein
LRRVYEASRLYTNFFQPSFKLKSKYREGARVHKQYELPDTPYRRLLAREDVPPATKEMLKLQMELLDPVLLLKHVRDAQDTVMALSQASGYGEFSDGQLRALQRRVRVWRMLIVQQLVYGAGAAAAPNKSPSPEPPHGM